MLKLNCFLTSILLFSICSILSAQDSYNYTNASSEQFRTKGEKPIDTQIKRLLRIDAARLSIRMRGDLSNQSLAIPKDQLDLFYKILLNIYIQDDLAKELTACGVHTTPNPSVDYMELIYDQNIDWAAPLQEGVATTNNRVLNQLMEQYDLIIQSQRQIGQGEAAFIIRSAEPINMAALANQLYEIEGVKQINLGIEKVKNTDIEIAPNKNGWKVTYMLRFQEGQTSQQHSWVYYVRKNFKVEFLTEAGAPIPDGLGCQ